MHNNWQWPEKYIKKQEKDLSENFDQIFDLIKKEYINHIYEMFAKNHKIIMESGDILTAEKTWISDKNNIKQIRTEETRVQQDQEYMDDFLIPQMIAIDTYKWVIKSEIDDIFQTKWKLREIYSYFEDNMWWLEISKELKNKIIEYNWKKEIYQKFKNIYTKKVEYQKLYTESLLSHPIDINKYNISHWLKNQISSYERQFAELWDLQLWMDEHNTYFISISNIYIWWFHAVMSWDNIWNLIILFYSKLQDMFLQKYRIYKQIDNKKTYYKIDKENKIYISKIEENTN